MKGWSSKSEALAHTSIKPFPRKTFSMPNRSLSYDEALRELITQTQKHLIGQDAAIAAFAAEICRHNVASSTQQRPGIFLVAGPNVDGDHLGLPSGLADSFRTGGGLYELASSQAEDLANVLAPTAGGTEARSLLYSLKHNPTGVLVLQDIDKAHPRLLRNLTAAWSQGFADDEAGEKISLASVIFVLTTEVAQEQIGQIARDEPDTDRLHVECLKALVDAGFPASLLRYVDFAIGLKRLTAGELMRAYYERFATLVAAHGLVLEDGGLDARILLHAIDPTAEPTVPDLMLPWDNLSDRLAQIKAAGAGTVRLILDEEVIRILTIERGTPQPVIGAFAAANRDLSADGEAIDG
jgi:hypothetical protein